jgi:hypothetical protein
MNLVNLRLHALTSSGCRNNGVFSWDPNIRIHWGQPCLKAIVFTHHRVRFVPPAQADRAAVTGRFLDPSHSMVPDAKVSLVYPGTGLRRETQSSSRGLPHRSAPIGECYLEVGAGLPKRPNEAFYLLRSARRAHWTWRWNSAPAARA